MKRKELMRQVSEETRRMTLAYYSYMHTDREYIPGQKLHLREIHFLVCVGGKRQITITELADSLDITQGAVSQIATRLLKKELIQKRKGEPDKRYTYIELTPAGERVYHEYQQYDRKRREEVDACFADFTDEELRAILKYETLARKICQGLLAQETLLD